MTELLADRVWGALGLSVVCVYLLPDAVVVLALAYFLGTSPYYPETFMNHMKERCRRAANDPEEEELLPEPVLQALQGARRVGSRSRFHSIF